MLHTYRLFKKDIDRAKAWAEENRDLLFYSLGVGVGVGACAVVFNIKVKSFNKQIKAFAYQKGWEMGEMQVAFDEVSSDLEKTIQYLADHDLMDDFAQFAGWEIKHVLVEPAA